MSRRSKTKSVRNPDSAKHADPSINRPPADTLTEQLWLPLIICAFLAIAVWMVFGQTIHHQFVNFDDDLYVYNNSEITRGLSWHDVVWAFTHAHAENWHPLTTLTAMLDCQIYGLNPAGHHLTNVVIHAATAILLFLMLRQMTGALWKSAFVAGVFAIHPLRVESVAWVAERKDVLSGMFFMFTVWAYLNYTRKRDTKVNSGLSFFNQPRYWLVLVLFALGLMSKPMLVTLPFVLLLLDYWPLNRVTKPEFAIADWIPLILEKTPLLLLAVVSCIATILVQHHAIGSIHAFSFTSRVGNALVSYVAYLRQMLYPENLAVFYPHPENNLAASSIVFSGLILLFITGAVFIWRRKRPYLLTGWLWYLGMLVPVIGFLQVGDQSRADRYTYLPQIGLAIALTWVVAELGANWRYRKMIFGTVATVILAGLMLAAHSQTGYWKDSITLWTHALDCTTENAIAHNDLGMAFAAKGQTDEAIQHYERALQLDPKHVEAHINLGNELGNLGKLDEAIRHCEIALQLKPDSTEALGNLGNALAAQGKLDEAASNYNRFLQLKPDSAEVNYDLGIVLARQGKLADAMARYREALRINPDNFKFHNNLANALIRQGNPGEAIPHCERALQLKQDYAEAQFNWGNALLAQNKIEEADQHFQQALALAMAQNNSELSDAIRSRLRH